MLKTKGLTKSLCSIQITLKNSKYFTTLSFLKSNVKFF